MYTKDNENKDGIFLHKNTIFYVESCQIIENEDSIMIAGYAVYHEKYKWVDFESSIWNIKKKFIFLEHTDHPLGETFDNRRSHFIFFDI